MPAAVGSTLASVRGGFRTVARAAAPAAADQDEAAWTRGEALVEEALSLRPAKVRRQVVLFLRILGLLSRLRFGRSLEGLTAAQANRLFGALERSPLLLLRRGMWGVRTLAFMAYYGQAGQRGSIGYGAEAGGWEARGANQGPWPERRGAAPPEAGVLVAAPEDDVHA